MLPHFGAPESSELPLPRLPERRLSVALSETAVDVTRLLKPWDTPIRRPPAERPIVAPPPPPPTDALSVRYLGTLTRDGGGKTYLFKYLPTGTVLTLDEQQESQGWSLRQITEDRFTLQGPGGLYVVAR